MLFCSNVSPYPMLQKCLSTDCNHKPSSQFKSPPPRLPLCALTFFLLCLSFSVVFFSQHHFPVLVTSPFCALAFQCHTDTYSVTHRHTPLASPRSSSPCLLLCSLAPFWIRWARMTESAVLIPANGSDSPPPLSFHFFLLLLPCCNAPVLRNNS